MSIHDTINQLVASGQFHQAREICTRLCQEAPHDIEAWSMLGMINSRLGDLDATRHSFQKILELAPDNELSHFNYANACKLLGHFQEAIDHYQKAIQLNPAFAQAYFNMGNTMVQKDDLEQAVEHYQKAIQLDPAYARAYNNLGSALQQQVQINKAIECYHKAILLDPSNAESHYSLATALQENGQFSEAVDSYHKALELNPQHEVARSNLLYLLSYNVMCSPQEMLREHKEWDHIHGGPEKMKTFPHDLKRTPGGRIRIGYVSADFRQHVVSHFFESILANHDRSRIEVFCYAEVRKPDDMTRKLQKHAEHWRFISDISDREVAQQIHDDGIDILVDLGGHTVNNRLKVFTYKPAPIQVTYLGYFTSTGLSAMDYWITDKQLHPADTIELSTESLYRLPRCCLCYQPPTEVPDVRPVTRTGQEITFGCFNNLLKISPQAIELWCRIMQLVPHSRLLLKSRQMADQILQKNMLDRFAQHGISEERLIMMPHTRTFREHLETYSQVDIALDTIPRSGFTITAEALWMGIPVITLAGKRFIERVSMDMLSSIGLTELIGKTSGEYIACAVSLANNPLRRHELRNNLRAMMKKSSLCDGKALASSLEEAFLDMGKKAGLTL